MSNWNATEFSKMYKKHNNHICDICGELVDILDLNTDNAVFVSTKRKSNMWMHKHCVTSQYLYIEQTHIINE